MQGKERVSDTTLHTIAVQLNPFFFVCEIGMMVNDNRKKKRKLRYWAEATCLNADLVKYKTEKKIHLELPELYCFPNRKGKIQAISIRTELILQCCFLFLCWTVFCSVYINRFNTFLLKLTFVWLDTWLCPFHYFSEFWSGLCLYFEKSWF